MTWDCQRRIFERICWPPTLYVSQDNFLSVKCPNNMVSFSPWWCFKDVVAMEILQPYESKNFFTKIKFFMVLDALEDFFTELFKKKFPFLSKKTFHSSHGSFYWFSFLPCLHPPPTSHCPYALLTSPRCFCVDWWKTTPK